MDKKHIPALDILCETGSTCVFIIQDMRPYCMQLKHVAWRLHLDIECDGWAMDYEWRRSRNSHMHSVTEGSYSCLLHGIVKASFEICSSCNLIFSMHTFQPKKQSCACSLKCSFILKFTEIHPSLSFELQPRVGTPHKSERLQSWEFRWWYWWKFWARCYK